MQDYIFHNIKFLNSHNIFASVTHGTALDYSLNPTWLNLTLEMNRSRTDPYFLKQMQSETIKLLLLHENTNHTLILASEHFCFFTPKEIMHLKNALKAYRVQIVVIYRTWQFRAFSQFNQIVKIYNSFNLNRRRQKELVTNLFLNVPAYVTTRLIFIFGYDNITIIDFYGSLKQGKGPHQVFACDILKVCSNNNNSSSSNNTNSSTYHYPPSIHDNKSINITQYQKAEVLTRLITKLNCSTNKNFKSFLRYYNLHPSSTIVKFASKELIEYSHATGEKIYERYKLINAAALEDRNKVLQYKELDREEVFREQNISTFRNLLL